MGATRIVPIQPRWLAAKRCARGLYPSELVGELMDAAEFEADLEAVDRLLRAVHRRRVLVVLATLLGCVIFVALWPSLMVIFILLVVLGLGEVVLLLLAAAEVEAVHRWATARTHELANRNLSWRAAAARGVGCSWGARRRVHWLEMTLTAVNIDGIIVQGGEQRSEAAVVRSPEAYLTPSGTSRLLETPHASDKRPRLPSMDHTPAVVLALDSTRNPLPPELLFGGADDDGDEFVRHAAANFGDSDLSDDDSDDFAAQEQSDGDVPLRRKPAAPLATLPPKAASPPTLMSATAGEVSSANFADRIREESEARMAEIRRIGEAEA